MRAAKRCAAFAHVPYMRTCAVPRCPSLQDPAQRRIANLAASAARAARMWRFYTRSSGGAALISADSSASSMDLA